MSETVTKKYTCNYCKGGDECSVTVRVGKSTIEDKGTTIPKYCPVVSDMPAPWQEVGQDG